MTLDLQARSQYLSLALFAQRIVSALIELVDEGKSDAVDAYVPEALVSLRAVDDIASIAEKRAAAFTSYEHLRTLDEVWTKQDRAVAVDLLQTLVSSTTTAEDKKVDAGRLIDLFSRLQNQALWNFEQPKPVSQKILQQLCQTT